MRFNLVGVMGFTLQTVTLWVLVQWAGASTSIAITVAVLAAVSHNFVWHERFTWRDLPREHRLKRWLPFMFNRRGLRADQRRRHPDCHERHGSFGASRQHHRCRHWFSHELLDQ
jgi:hypothetical protein